ncbi:hypothetical protein [Paenibacillus elgii]|uniref:hypothetical protein n=1 Tax=Paenibacillus elgii TaxID=189691 RepID=UPI00204092A3|nr:hypothetical protein [Paenibacillus elgii]MCM3271146.1 hypothetical protein [Paenibacillus elgii]
MRDEYLDYIIVCNEFTRIRVYAKYIIDGKEHLMPLEKFSDPYQAELYANELAEKLECPVVFEIID